MSDDIMDRLNQILQGDGCEMLLSDGTTKRVVAQGNSPPPDYGDNIANIIARAHHRVHGEWPDRIMGADTVVDEYLIDSPPRSLE